MLVPILVMSGMGVLVLLMFGFYAWLMINHPDTLMGGVSTFMIIYNHVQTISIFSQLQLRWPPTVLAIIEMCSINLFSIEIGRPECLIGDNMDEESGGPFYMINMYKFLVLLVFFAAILVAQQVCYAKGAFGFRLHLPRSKAARKDRDGARWEDRDR